MASGADLDKVPSGSEYVVRTYPVSAVTNRRISDDESAVVCWVFSFKTRQSAVTWPIRSQGAIL